LEDKYSIGVLKLTNMKIKPINFSLLL